MKNLNIKIYKEFNTELEDLWINFEKTSDNYYFQTCSWQKYWFKQMNKHKKKSITNHIVVVKNENDILFILPMYISRFLFFKTLCWSGFPFSDYNAPLIKKNLNISKETFLIIWKLILEKNNNLFNCINLNNQPKMINQIFNPFFQYLNSINTGPYFGIILNNSSESINSQIADVKYQTKRLNRDGNLVFNIASTKKERKRVLKFILKNKIAQYIKTDGWNLFNINAYKFFFIECHLKLHSNLYLSYLSLNKNIIAAHSGYIYENNCYYLFPTYDEDFKKYSPGKILLNSLIEDSKIRKLYYFDFTIGSENYKKKWSNNKMDSGTTLKALDFIGLIYVLFIKIRISLKPLIINNNFFNKIYYKIK